MRHTPASVPRFAQPPHACHRTQPALDEFVNDKIALEELGRRKQAAREQAAAEHPPLQRLDAAFTAYRAALEARSAAEQAEDAAEAELEAAVLALEKEGGGPSGAVKQEEASPEAA